ncbi:hypothetical protein KIN20_002871 [Parelaphostrongylus tenuis]|uniref:Uncharacterized protein n=1 Tax=Parelaphostrongylus tenuis TaxID=148309 RepID=A0AAD5MHF6_PARTN|nr:hypothetical protein KIN20_002871 [Parelaphostrongylus tenuis]
MAVFRPPEKGERARRPALSFANWVKIIETQGFSPTSSPLSTILYIMVFRPHLYNMSDAETPENTSPVSSIGTSPRWITEHLKTNVQKNMFGALTLSHSRPNEGVSNFLTRINFHKQHD